MPSRKELVECSQVPDPTARTLWTLSSMQVQSGRCVDGSAFQVTVIYLGLVWIAYCAQPIHIHALGSVDCIRSKHPPFGETSGGQLKPPSTTRLAARRTVGALFDAPTQHEVCRSGIVGPPDT